MPHQRSELPTPDVGRRLEGCLVSQLKLSTATCHAEKQTGELSSTLGVLSSRFLSLKLCGIISQVLPRSPTTPTSQPFESPDATCESCRKRLELARTRRTQPNPWQDVIRPRMPLNSQTLNPEPRLACPSCESVNP